MSRAMKPPARPRPVTALDVARLAGVSRSAVSRTLTEGASVSAETRAKVLAAAQTLGYHRNALVRGMITRRSGIIGVVTGGLDNPFLAIALESLSRRLQRDGRKAFIYSGDAESDLQRALPGMIEYRVDGCMFLTNDISPHATARYRQHGVPIVLLFSAGIAQLASVPGPAPVGAVTADNFETSRRLAHHMAGKGARCFAYVAGHPDSSSSGAREAGFRQGLNECGHDIGQVVAGDFTYGPAAEAARGLLDGKDRPDAVFCGNDLMAMAVLDVARGELGLRVPEDLMVAGFDDTPLAAGAAYDLTSVRQSVPRMIDAAADMMADFIDDPASASREVMIEAELILRGSTR
jgi:DNA-binding LacI/PurR family transcriptional regulator